VLASAIGMIRSHCLVGTRLRRGHGTRVIAHGVVHHDCLLSHFQRLCVSDIRPAELMHSNQSERDKEHCANAQEKVGSNSRHRFSLGFALAADMTGSVIRGRLPACRSVRRNRASSVSMSVTMSVKHGRHRWTLTDKCGQQPSKLKEINRTLAGLERTTDQKVGGSNPSGRTKEKSPLVGLFSFVFSVFENPVRVRWAPTAEQSSALLVAGGTLRARDPPGIRDLGSVGPSEISRSRELRRA
jgi:hypothetical protein